MKLLLKRTHNGFIPTFDDDVTALSKVPIGDDIIVEYKPKRNVMFHRKLFALLNAVIPNQKVHKTVDNLLNEIKLRSGHFEIHVTSKGEQLYVPKSISFDSMNGVEFEMFYQRALDVAVELTDEQAINEIIKFM